jgi:hypothetical protein
MATAKCTKQYFQNLSDVAFNINWLTYLIELSYNFKAARPFIPIAILDPTNNYEVDFVNSAAFPTFCKDIMEDCLSASYNYLADSVADPKYTAGEYASYLGQRIGVKTTDERYQRYKTIYNTVLSYWDNFVTSGDYVTDLTNLEQLIGFLKVNTDKRYWVAPGSYHVSGANPSNVTMDAINLANPTWLGNVPVLILELDSIG